MSIDSNGNDSEFELPSKDHVINKTYDNDDEEIIETSEDDMTGDIDSDADNDEEVDLEDEKDLEVEKDNSDEIEIEKNYSSESLDPLNLYLKEMGSISRITKEEEVLKAKEIEDTESKIIDAIMTWPKTLQCILEQYYEEKEKQFIREEDRLKNKIKSKEVNENICLSVIVDNTLDAFDEKTLLAIALPEEEVARRKIEISIKLENFIEEIKKEITLNRTINDGKKRYKRNQELFNMVQELKLDKILVSKIVDKIKIISTEIKELNYKCIDILEKLNPKKRKENSIKFMKSYSEKSFIWNFIPEEDLSEVKSYVNKKNMPNEQIANYVEKVNIFKNCQKELLRIEQENNMLISDFKNIVKTLLHGKSRVDRVKKEMVEANLRLVVAIAKRHANKLKKLEVIQEGNIGLMKAVDKFDYRRGFRFSTYATWWIRQSINRATADQSRIVRIPVHMVENMQKIERVRKVLKQKLERNPTAEELSKESEISLDKVLKALGVVKEPISMETPVGGDEDESTISDFIEDSFGSKPIEETSNDVLIDILEKALVSLSQREQDILRMRFGFGVKSDFTLEEVGKRFDVTRERIRQIEVKALKSIKDSGYGDSLKVFLKDLS